MRKDPAPRSRCLCGIKSGGRQRNIRNVKLSAESSLPDSPETVAMPFVTSAMVNRTYDVIVVGSGAAGGQSAYTLSMEGAKVLMLEAGRKYIPKTETPMLQTPEQAPLRGASTPDKRFGF